MAVDEQKISRRRQYLPYETRETREYLIDDLIERHTLGGLYLVQGTLMYVASITVERFRDADGAGTIQWTEVVDYTTAQPFEANDPSNYEWDYDLSAVSEVQQQRVPGTALDKAGELTPGEVPKYVPGMIYRVSRDETTFPRDTVLSLSGKLNDATFLDRLTRTWMFLGAVSRKIGYHKWRSTYSFHYKDDWKHTELGVAGAGDDEDYELYTTGDFTLLNLQEYTE